MPPRVWNRKTERPPAGAIWVGRPSKWGNPYSEIPGVVAPEFMVESHGEAVSKYREYLEANPALLDDARKELRGKDLICVCHPKPCHAAVLFEISNR
jgi:hypothetical protein